MLLSIGERRALAEALDRAGMDLPNEVDIVWDRDIIDDGVLGQFRWWRPNEIVIGGDATMLDLLTSTVAHELAHRAQFKKAPVFYVLVCALWLKGWALEPDARAVELAVDLKLGKGAINK
jgi:hypothetical protein